MADALVPNKTEANGNERDALGRFGPNNKAARGNPGCKRVAELRAALLSEMTDEKLREVVRKAIELAIAGDVAAIKEVLDRALGKPKQAMEIEGGLQIWKLYDKDAPTDEV